MSVLLPSDKLLGISCWLIPCCRHSLLLSVRSCVFWQGQFLCQNTSTALPIVMSFRMTCWMLSFPTHLNFSFQLCLIFGNCCSCNGVLFPCDFTLPDMIITMDATPSHWALYFQGSGLPLSLSETWSGSMCKASIALQELMMVVLMLHRIAFNLTSKVVSLHLDNSIA